MLINIKIMPQTHLPELNMIKSGSASSSSNGSSMKSSIPSPLTLPSTSRPKPKKQFIKVGAPNDVKENHAPSAKSEKKTKRKRVRTKEKAKKSTTTDTTVNTEQSIQDMIESNRLKVKQEPSESLMHKFVDLNSCISAIDELSIASERPTEQTSIKKPSKRSKNKAENFVPTRVFRRTGAQQRDDDDEDDDGKADSKDDTFPAFLLLDDVMSGVNDGELIVGHIRINQKNWRQAYVNQKDRALQDYVLPSIIDRNRTFEGDEVVLKVKPSTMWRDGQKTASVVYILKKVHPRTAVGTLRMPNKKKQFVTFIPRDARIPKIRINVVDCPRYFLTQPEKYQDDLFLAKVTHWSNVNYAIGTLLNRVGPVGSVSVENKAILVENCLDVRPFTDEEIDELPDTDRISDAELSVRADLRTECIFTIDPATARDLDDAVSCKELDNGNLEIGVHISDVTHYLKEGTVLDERVSQKATTIYLVDAVYHMLPLKLCMHCSLLPGKDKYAFSVVWEMTRDGEIVTERFTKSVVNCCAQLSYEHAQLMIDDPDKDFDASELPPIHNGYESNALSKVVNNLQRIAVKLRKARYDNGALSINQAKVSFHLNKETGLPDEMFVYENRASHRLIEEFMLLANIRVAKRIEQRFPKLAFLRSHYPPAGHMLQELQSTLEELGIHLDVSSSGALQRSLAKYCSDDSLGVARGALLNHLCAKTMTRAHYYCSADATDEDDYLHYALSIPIYTHFTSPIRRYADVMVHRLLYAALNDHPVDWKANDVAEIAANCNKQKYNAKKAGEASIDLYMCKYVELRQPFVERAVVVNVMDHSFDVLILKTGTIARVPLNVLEGQQKITWEVEKSGSANQKTWKIRLKWSGTAKTSPSFLILQIFTIINVALVRKDNKSNKLLAIPLPPNKL